MKTSTQAIFLVILAAFATAVMEVTAKSLVAVYAVMPLLALRSGMSLIALGSFGLWRSGTAPFKTRRPALQILRMLTVVATSGFFFLSLRHLPLADATAIFFGSVFFMVVLSWPLLGERISLRRLAPVLVGLAGVGIVIKPDFNIAPIGGIYGLLAALSYALSMLIGRKLSDTESTFTLVFYGNLGVCLASALFIPAQWLPMSPGDFSLVAVMSLFTLIAHFCIVQAFSLADVGTVAPFEYSGVLWAVVLGYLLLDEIPAVSSLVGAAIVIAAGCYVVMLSKAPGGAPGAKSGAEPAAPGNQQA